MIDIRQRYKRTDSLAFIRADLARQGYRLSNNVATWFAAYRIH